MKNKSNIASTVGMIAVFGLVSVFLSSDFQIGSYFEGLEIDSLEVLLEYLSFGLGFLTFSILFIALILQAGKGEKKFYWDFEKDDFKKDQ